MATARVVVIVSGSDGLGLSARVEAIHHLLHGSGATVLVQPPTSVVDASDLQPYCIDDVGPFPLRGLDELLTRAQPGPSMRDVLRSLTIEAAPPDPCVWPDAPHRGPPVPQPRAERVRGSRRMRHVAAPRVRINPAPRRRPRRWRAKHISRGGRA